MLEGTWGIDTSSQESAYGPKETFTTLPWRCGCSPHSRHSLRLRNHLGRELTDRGTLQTLIAFGSMAGFSTW